MPKKQIIEVEGRELAISNVDKVYFPESGFTKGEVIAFYSEIAEVILPHLRDRPLTLKRFPEGINREYFYEKNAPKHTPLWVQRFAVPRSEDGARINYVLCNDRATLVWVTNLGDIEKHAFSQKRRMWVVQLPSFSISIPANLRTSLIAGEWRYICAAFSRR
jgi:bifunctional non-homologous end joining protein LigD